jgi:hypothetical protein
MATARLIDSQKQELVRRFRQGESTQALADHFGCSATTITRLVRAEMSPDDYAALRDQRQRKAGRDRQIPLAIGSASGVGAVELDLDPTLPASVADLPALTAKQASLSDVEAGGGEVPTAAAPEQVHPAVPLQQAGENALPVSTSPADPAAAEPESRGKSTEIPNEEEAMEHSSAGSAVLAIDDADDFADEGESEEDLLATDEDADEEGVSTSQEFHPVAVLPIAVDDQRETRPTPWRPEVLPSCAYLLVDKTVELQARPLGDIPELGRLPSEEQEQQALVLFTNPRQAKRLCGRTQRVIKLPDPSLLGRTAPYLRAQGISRIVIEGALYALPEGQ